MHTKHGHAGEQNGQVQTAGSEKQVLIKQVSACVQGGVFTG